MFYVEDSKLSSEILFNASSLDIDVENTGAEDARRFATSLILFDFGEEDENHLHTDHEF